MTARVLAPTPENLALAAQRLRQGAVVGMPTETVYGLAGAAFDSQALARIFGAKERPTFDPLIVHVTPLGSVGVRGLEDLARLKLVSLEILSAVARERAERLIAEFWPGPLTLVLPKHPDVPDLCTSGLPSVGIRMPRHPVAQALIAEAGTPLAAPSANRFGRISPTSAAHVRAELGDRIELILDGGPCEVGLESSVVVVNPWGELTLLRPGGIPRSEIERVAGAAVSERASVSSPGEAQQSPGTLESHYAPAKPLLILAKPISQLRASDLESLLAKFPQAKKIGLLLQARTSLPPSLFGERETISEHLSETGDLAEVARNLFSRMRALDESDADLILAEPCEASHGLGHAIADRLRRAGAKRS